MRVYITSFYMNPKLSLDVSHKVYKYLDKCFNSVLRNTKIDGIDELMIILDVKRIRKVSIVRRRISKIRNQKVKTVSVALPYSNLCKGDKEFLFNFVSFVCDTTVDILIELGVLETRMKKVKEKCLSEILNNSKYEYRDEG